MVNCHVSMITIWLLIPVEVCLMPAGEQVLRIAR